MEQIRIQTDFIKLQQALKLAGLVDQGSDVKVYLAEGMVTVNGQTVSHTFSAACAGISPNTPWTCKDCENG